MRNASGNRFPAIAVWENVIGARLSGNRLDYLAVLRAFTGAEIPMPASGQWADAGMVRGRRCDLAWRILDAQYWASPRIARRQRIFLVADFTGQRAGEILFKPRPLLQNPDLRNAGGVSAAEANRGNFIEAGRRIPVVQPFSGLRMRGGAKHHDQRMFLRSFGKRTDPFPTLLASELYPFAFWYEDDPGGGCIRFLTETECERLMGLPEGWTKYGADGREICSTNRYAALGNAIALPCAEYIMAGIAEVMG